MEYKLIPEERFDDVIQHLRHSFFADEPLNKAAGLCQQGQGNLALERYSCETLEDNLSLMALSQSNEVCYKMSQKLEIAMFQISFLFLPQVAGVILNGVLHPGDIESAQKKLELSDDEDFKKVFQLLYSHNLKVNIFEKFNVEKAFDVRVLSVDSRFRGQGIAKELVRRSEHLARDFEFKVR